MRNHRAGKVSILELAFVALTLSLLAFLFSFLFRARAYEIKPDPPQPTITHREVTDIWANYPILKRVCSCESWGDPNKEPREDGDDGNLLRGYPNPNDVGACQIHVPVWGQKAKQLGYDIYTLQGNVQMAKYILKVQGLQAWKASQSCWE